MKKKFIFIFCIFLIQIILLGYNGINARTVSSCSSLTVKTECSSSETNTGISCSWDDKQKKCSADQSSTPDVDNCAGFSKVFDKTKDNKNACLKGQTKNAGNFGCAWNEQYEFCSPNGLAYLSCGGTDDEDKDSIAYDIPVMVPRLSSYAITALKTITPVILIIIGMFQLIKAIASQNEDEMKKARSALIKKLIAAVMIFFLVAIVQFVVKQVADDAEQSSTEACFNCFINNSCDGAMYYTDGYGNCYSVKTNEKLDSCPVDKY